jgi:serine/threonine protein kinase
MLEFDPIRRISAADALNHEWFKSLPLAVKISNNIPRTTRNEQWVKAKVEKMREKTKEKSNGIQKPCHKGVTAGSTNAKSTIVKNVVSSVKVSPKILTNLDVVNKF